MQVQNFRNEYFYWNGRHDCVCKAGLMRSFIKPEITQVKINKSKHNYNMYSLFRRCNFWKPLHVSASSPGRHQVISLKLRKLYNVWHKIWNFKFSNIQRDLVFVSYKNRLYRVTQKTGTFVKPNKNWRNPRKKNYWKKLNHYNLPFKRQ